MNESAGADSDNPSAIGDQPRAVFHRHREIGQIVLAREAPVRLGPVEIDPVRRRVAHDDGREEFLEPRVMQVLVALVTAQGRILTRDELLASCWRGVVVGDDAINRVIGRVRRLCGTLGAGVFEIETLTRVGYRLVIFTADNSRVSTLVLAAASERPALALPTKPSIAVLPFKNLSGDPQKEYLADAISEDLITALSHWRWFFVIARRSSFTFSDNDINPVKVGQELGVRYLLSGSVRASGQSMRLTAQLIDATTGANIWAERFDRPLVDVLSLNDEVSEQIAAAIEPAMLESEVGRLERKSLADFSAMDCFYRGMWQFNQITAPAHAEALALFRKAIHIDPSLALGHVGIARSLYGRVVQGESADSARDLEDSRASARTAIRLDPREATAHFAAAGAELYLGEHDVALDEARLALSLNSNLAYAHYRLGQVLIFAGRPEEAFEPLRRTLSLSPVDPQASLVFETLALAHYQTRDYEAAAEFAYIANRGQEGAVSAVLIASLARLGRFEECSKAMASVDPARSSPRRLVAAPYAAPSYREHMREGLRLGREAFERGI